MYTNSQNKYSTRRTKQKEDDEDINIGRKKESLKQAAGSQANLQNMSMPFRVMNPTQAAHMTQVQTK